MLPDKRMPLTLAVLFLPSLLWLRFLWTKSRAVKNKIIALIMNEGRTKRTRLVYSSFILVLGVYWIVTAVMDSQAQSSPVADVVIYYTQAGMSDAGQVMVSAYVSVLDAEGQPVLDLTKNNFTVVENEKTIGADLISVSKVTEPMTVILVMDTSNSMAMPGSDRVIAIDAVKEAARNFIPQALTEGSQVAIYSFDNKVIQEQDLTGDQNVALNEIDPLDYHASTQACLYDALVEALEKLALVPTGRRAVIVMTNAGEFPTTTPCQGHTASEVIREALNASVQVPVFSIGLNEANHEELTNLAASTNGRHFTADSIETAKAQLQKIANLFQDQYLLTYPTQAAVGLHTVMVVAEGKGGQARNHRPVFVPIQVTPTPIPPPSFSMDLGYSDNRLEIQLDLTGTKDVTLVELFVDNALEQRIRIAPFNKFAPLDITTLGTGEHSIRVEVTTAQKGLAIQERKFIVKATPTPVPTSTPLPPTPAPAPLVTTLIGERGYTIVLSILIAAVLLSGAAIFYYKFRTRAETRSKLFTYDEMLDRSPESEKETEDEGGEGGKPLESETISEAELTQDVQIGIKLTVTEGQKYVDQEVYEFDASQNILIGRDDEAIKKGVVIKDSSVSRRHAQIRHSGYVILIKDLGSRHGTLVDDQFLEPQKEKIVSAGAMIKIGKVEFRAEITEGNLPEPLQSLITKD